MKAGLSAALALSCFMVVGSVAHAQQPLITLRPASPIQAAAPTTPPVAAAAPASGAAASAAVNEQAEAQRKAAEEQRKQEAAQRTQMHQQKIPQLQFDRRPSAILGAWAAADKEARDAIKNAALAAQKAADLKEVPPEPKPEVPPEPKRPAPPPAPAGLGPDTFDQQIAILQRNVTLGRWPEVRHYLADLGPELSQPLYLQILQSLQGVPAGTPNNVPPHIAAQLAQMRAMQMQQQGQQPERNSFAFEDILGLASCATGPLDDNTLASLGAILGSSLEGGNVVEKFLELGRAEVAKPKIDRVVSERNVARMLFAAGRPVEAGEFLPTIETAKAENDFDGLNLLSQHFLAKHATEKKTVHLEKAWEVTQAVLAGLETQDAQKDEALRRAVELAPKIREELGQAWLDESFTNRPQRGMEILASIGGVSAQGLQQQLMDADFRLKVLELQTTAVESLLKASPERAAEWQSTLSLLAGNWLREAGVSYEFDESTRRGPNLQRDPFGNYFYYEDGYFGPRQRRPIAAIKTGDLLEIKPGVKWLEYVDASLKPKFDMVFAQLFLKVQEEDNAFPYIEKLASVYPKQAQNLVDEFLQVWTTNHDPNANRNRTNYYMFMYGFEQKAEGIPLTRSKQERNLVELSALVTRLRALPLEKLNEELLAKAFTTCHSTAEVYRLDAIEKVFGSVDKLEPKTLAELVQQMRANLVGVWREPAEQKDKQTKRKQKDIEAEVLRGYEVARTVVENSLRGHPDDWSLQLARAAIEHDENDYRKVIKPDSKFSERRDEALAGFKRAADLYARQVPNLAQDEENTKVYELWYYASLGACDLGQITEERVPDLRQPAQIRDAILALPGESAKRHMSMFANSLFTRMSAVKPAVKFRYVRTGLEIVGDHKQAIEARRLFDYYNDLVTEIKFETVVDGSDVVGHEKPFGLFVNIRHTREIERESGGFGKYLQNQNDPNRFFYNYGRPLENYRDKFEEVVKQAFAEHFEIQSVTFQTENVNSRALPEYGWRVTPYAYVLLKARGPEVDKIPPLRLDLDFLDTSGYAVLPIESPTVPIDATQEPSEARPHVVTQLTQTLDERQADEGKLIVEVKATAQGLVPELQNLVELNPPGFEVVGTEDQGVSVARFDPDSERSLVISERTWLVNLKAQEGLPAKPKTFEFGKPKLDVRDVAYQRYNDADLAAVEPVVSLEQVYGKTSYAWVAWASLAAVAAVVALGWVAVWARRRPKRAHSARFRMPDELTPFTVLGLLRQIEAQNGLSPTGKQELADSINRLERHYFVGEQSEHPDLQQLAASWLQKTH